MSKKDTEIEKSTPIDREANEIEMVDFTVTIRGKDVNLTAPAAFDDLPFDVALKVEDRKHMNALAEILGEQQLMKIRALRATASDFSSIFTALNEAWGLGEG